MFIALDWAKAFDSISPARLCDALRSFGIPVDFIELIRSIYGGRRFFVKDMGVDSETHAQHFGVSQGWPLSPFLFIIVMTILMHDAKIASQQLYPNVEADPYTVHELLYADDTLLIGTESNQIQSYMNVVVDLGATYGLQLNWKKVELLAARCSPIINDK